MILEPLVQFLVDYKINNPSDTATYYVQAVVKDAVLGTTLATLNLTDRGSLYFSKVYTLPADLSGVGRQITITRTVYTDSGYTAISPAYGASIDTYIVRHLASQNLGGFTTRENGAASAERERMNLGELERIIRKVVGEIPPAAETKETDISGLAAQLEMLEEKLEEHGTLADIRATQTEDFIKENIDAAVSPLFAFMGSKIEELRSELLENLGGSSEEAGERHARVHEILDELKSSLDGIANDSTLHDKVDEVGKALVDSHKALHTAIGAPINLKIEQGGVKREEPEDDDNDDSEESVARAARSERIENLMKLIPPGHD